MSMMLTSFLPRDSSRPAVLLVSTILSIVILSVPAVAQEDAASYDAELSRVGTEIASCLETGSTLRIGTMDFTDLQGQANELGRWIAEELSTELVVLSRQHGFEVIDRGHLSTILEEHKLSSSGLVSAETTKQLGEFAGLDIIITGNVLTLEKRIRMTVKALSTETASITCASRGDLPRTMAIDEMLAIAVGESVGPRRTTNVTSQPTESPTPAPSYKGQDIAVKIISITKDRTGKKLQLSLEITSTREKPLYLALDGDSEAVLIDNVGAEWRLVRFGGIRQFPKGESRHPYRVDDFISQFLPKVPHTINLIFQSDGSAGTKFSLGASLLSYRSSGLSGAINNIPFGISEIELR